MVRKVYTARNGARYIKLANGQCRFVSGASRQYLNRIRTMRGGNDSGYEFKLNISDPAWEHEITQENVNELIVDYNVGDLTIDIISAASHEGSFYVKFETNGTWARASGMIMMMMVPRLALMDATATVPFAIETIMTVTNRVNGEVVFNKRLGDIDWDRPIWSV